MSAGHALLQQHFCATILGVMKVVLVALTSSLFLLATSDQTFAKSYSVNTFKAPKITAPKSYVYKAPKIQTFKPTTYRNYTGGGTLKYQNGYFKPSTGTYVQGYLKTKPDNYTWNNRKSLYGY
ncbi:MAG: hypothetical protein NT141_01720 [candidate division WWE3 bacterium]|nr:hypothetical protein [candidate division WWE3 bacterium]